ncbi:hypothetical protein IRJ41_013134 [Triplophysa rosa]|uniref:Uncharacterized protein n=1 Tax=Triplophysa rosa TaxID=992332 RepID=A0A9W7TM13_TRIRA|nr:hypothetical protein IRJ41_013134 [Triplophysa rosa]
MAGQPPTTTAATNVVESMAQALVTAISRELTSGRNTPVSTPARPPCGSLNNITSCNSTVQTSNTITNTSTTVNEALKRYNYNKL